MLLDELPLTDISEAQLLRLKEAQVPEGRTVDYKRDTYGGNNDQKREFLKDIVSFANSRGGHIIIGMDAKDGLPTELVGVGEPPDPEVLRLENLARDGIEPRVGGLQMLGIRLSNDRHAIAIHVPQSWMKPHRVSAGNANRFYVRNSAGVHEPSMDELRGLFTESLTREETARNLRAQRMALIRANQTGFPNGAGARALLHLIPFSALTGDAQVDFDAAVRCMKFMPMGGGGCNYGFNLYGLAFTRPNPELGYLQLFRTGMIETARSGIDQLANGGPGVHAFAVGQSMLKSVRDYLQGYALLGVSSPVIVSLTLMNVNNCRIVCGEDCGAALPAHTLMFPDVVFRHFDGISFAPLRPILDALWNAGGQEFCPNLSKEGRWTVSDS
jgi:Putative DNA-binding domain